MLDVFEKNDGEMKNGNLVEILNRVKKRINYYTKEPDGDGLRFIKNN